MRIVTLLPALALASSLAFAAEPSPPPRIATVDGRAISVAEFDQALAVAVRQRYYHRTPPEGEMTKVRREVADSLVDLALVAAEAKRLGIEPDAARVDRDLATIEKRFSGMPGWAEHREPQVARWRADLEERSRADLLERKVRAEVAPTPEQVRRFYDANPALFTEPERVRAGLILLKVDPSAGKSARDRARDEAASIRERLRKGADFAELAKIHSGDESAAKGGDLGYVHRGALPEPVQAVVDKLDGGRVSDPVDVLEGVALIRVTDRKPAERRPYDAVRDRARDLLRRQATEEAWRTFVAGLRAKAKIDIDERRYPELAAAPEAARTNPPSAR